MARVNQRGLAVCGIAAPIFFTLVVIVLASIQPGYSHIDQEISLLGQEGAPHAIVQNLNFVVSGFLLVGFAVGLHKGLSDGDGSRWGPGLLALAGLGMVGAGLFPTTTVEGGTAIDWSAFTSIMHIVTSTIFFFGIMLSMYALSRRLAKDARWKGYDRYAKWGSLVALGLVVLYSVAGTDGLGLLPDGVLQRLYLGWVGIWVEVTAVHLFRTSKRSYSGKRST